MPTFSDDHVFFPNAACDCKVLLEEVRPNIYHTQYDLRGFPFAKRLDWYAVIEPGKRALLIDVGSWELVGTEMLDQVVERFDVPWENIEVFMTHFHVDHEESLGYCLARGVRRVYCGPQNALDAASFARWGMLSGSDRAGDRPVIDVVISVGNRLSETSIPHEEVVLPEGGTIEIAGYKLRVVYTPGHTAEHAILFEEGERFIFGGDHIIESAPGIMQWDKDQRCLQRYLDTFPRIKNMRPSGVYMSHHEAFHTPEEVANCIDAIVASYDHPLTKVYSILEAAERPVTAYEAAEAYRASKPGGLAGFIDDLRCRQVSNMFGYLEYLHDTGEAMRRVASDGALEYWVEKNG